MVDTNQIYLIDFFRAAANRFPDKPAIIADEETLSYAGLLETVERTAAHLLKEGVVPGDHIGLSLADDSRFLIAFLATRAMGGTVVPMDYRARAPEKRRHVESFDISIVLEHRRPPGDSGYPHLVIDDEWQEAVRGTDRLSTYRYDGGKYAVISPTSGTTGQPQGVTSTNIDEVARFIKYLLNYTIGVDDRFMNVLPLAFRGGWPACLNRLREGGTVILCPTLFSAEELIGWTRRYRPRSTVIVPSHLRAVLEVSGYGRPLLEGLDGLICAGAPLTPEEKRAAKRIVSPAFSEHYAASVVGVISRLGPEDIDRHAESVGRPIRPVVVEIVDEAHNRLPAGETGLLRCRGPGMAGEIYGARDDESGDQLHDGWAYPGELAAIDEQGFIHLRGRANEMIVRGGSNIFPEEIETILTEHANVVEAAVVAWPSQRLGDDIAAFIVPRGDVAVNALMGHCRDRLSAHKRPRQIFLVDSLPRNTNGKVLKTDLQARLPALDSDTGTEPQGQN